MTDKTGGSGDSNPGNRAFDPEVMMEHLSGDVELMNELKQICLTECAGLMEQIRRAVADRDAARLGYASHTLRGALLNFGAARTVQAAERLESLARCGSLDKLEEYHQEVEAAWSEFERELNDYVP